ncbi:DUF742 domain-containing protein [Actinokineospora soli]|uniref:DUF742 domain-containing protein n=1 Tax=Actinokineospora soli TaxID=1048753 RepID=A0ABW2TP24_9PSEU
MSDDRGFAELLNGFTLDRGGRRGRRGGRREPEPAAAPERPERAAEPGVEEHAEIVRAYAWTAGRTRPDADLEVETLVSAADGPARAALPAEHHTVVELCRSTRSVAEVAALLSLPLGVVKVLVGDLAGRGLVVVHRGAAAPDLRLMERVLTGLRRL